MFSYLSAKAVTTMAALPVDVPDPGDGKMPPGFDGFVDIMGWIKWLALGALVIALIVAGAMMALNQRRGEGGEDAARIMKVLIGAIIVSAAVSLIGFLVN